MSGESRRVLALKGVLLELDNSTTRLRVLVKQTQARTFVHQNSIPSAGDNFRVIAKSEQLGLALQAQTRLGS